MAGRFFNDPEEGGSKDARRSGCSTTGGGVSTIVGTGGGGSLVLVRVVAFGDADRRVFAGADLCLSGTPLEFGVAFGISSSNDVDGIGPSSSLSSEDDGRIGSVATRSNLYPLGGA
jgi:hypothetical protein